MDIAHDNGTFILNNYLMQDLLSPVDQSFSVAVCRSAFVVSFYLYRLTPAPKCQMLPYFDVRFKKEYTTVNYIQDLLRLVIIPTFST